MGVLFVHDMNRWVCQKRWGKEKGIYKSDSLHRNNDNNNNDVLWNLIWQPAYQVNGQQYFVKIHSMYAHYKYNL